MEYEWMNNGEYWVNIEDIRCSIMRDSLVGLPPIFVPSTELVEEAS